MGGWITLTDAEDGEPVMIWFAWIEGVCASEDSDVTLLDVRGYEAILAVREPPETVNRALHDAIAAAEPAP